jgi:hypothetical protein
MRTRSRVALVVVASVLAVLTGSNRPIRAEDGRIAAGGVLRVSVPEAFGGKTVIGQLTVDRAVGRGFVTAYGCADGPPLDSDGTIARSDLNYNGNVTPVASNRLIVKADNDGAICFTTLKPAALIVDVNAVTFDTGITSFPNRRTDTRTGATPRVEAGGILRIAVPEAIGGKTVIGQLTVDRVDQRGYVAAYGCDDGLPVDRQGDASRSDLNFNGTITPVASNRLIVKADNDGEICFTTYRPAALIIDVNGVSDNGVGSFANRRTDTRRNPVAQVAGGGVLHVAVPEATGGKTVIGQLTVDQALGRGFVTAYGCDDGPPRDTAGNIARSDLNYNGNVTPVASNRLIVEADDDGDICFTTYRPAALIIDVNAVSDTGISSFPNRRTDTRAGDGGISGPPVDGVPVWPPYVPRPALDGVAALTGLPAGPAVTARPILAVKIDNYGPARPQWGLDQADAVFEVNVEGVTRFVALFHSRVPPLIGPVRSARTADLDLLTAMNRPVFAYSGANPGVTEWVRSAASSGVLVDYTAQSRPCYSRTPERPGPHNLVFDPVCVLANATTAGPAGQLWQIDGSWKAVGLATTPDTAFTVPMDGVQVGWIWDPSVGTYRRFQDGQPHLAQNGTQISTTTVVEQSATHIPSPVDARSPNPVTVGTGAAVIHRDGFAVPAIWSRSTAYQPFEFYDEASGAQIPLDTGTTFIEVTRAS